MIKVAVVGLGGRGFGIVRLLVGSFPKEVSVISLCDLSDERLKRAEKLVRDAGGDPLLFTDYKAALNVEGLDAAIVCTAWEAHMPVVLYALEKGIPVGNDAGNENTIENCWEMVRTQERTGTPFMFMENCCWDRKELHATAMARAGLFGTIVHCEGAYAHDLRHEIAYGIANYHYRFRHYKNRCLENYPTHDMGPISKLLGINCGNRMLTLTSVASKAAGLEEYIATRDDLPEDIKATRFAQGDIVDTLIRCSGGETVHLRLDTTLPRFYSRNFTVRGTKGSYWEATNTVFLDGMEKELEGLPVEQKTQKLNNNAAEYEEKYLPDIWKKLTPEEIAAGHGGIDYLCYGAFIRAVANHTPMPIDVYDGAAWLAIGALSEKSIALGGTAVEVPDFTRGAYLTRKNVDVTSF